MGFEWACTLTTIAFRLHVRSKAQGHTGKEHRGVCYSDVRYIAVGKWSGFMTADVSEILKVLHSGNRIRGE